MPKSALAVALPLVLAACSAPQEAPTAAPEPPRAATPAPKKVERASASPIAPLDQKKFGAAITLPASTPLDSLVQTPGKFAQQTVKTEGVVSAVCEHKGCWMEIADESGKAHIKMAGHAFFVPRQVSGHRAVVQGKVIAGDSDHCTEEAAEQTGSVAKIEIEATGVEFVD